MHCCCGIRRQSQLLDRAQSLAAGAAAVLWHASFEQRCCLSVASAPRPAVAESRCFAEASAQADAVDLLQGMGGQTQQGDGSAYGAAGAGAAAGGAAAASQVAHPPIVEFCCFTNPGLRQQLPRAALSREDKRKLMVLVIPVLLTESYKRC